MQFIYRSKPLPCIGKVDICFDNSLRPWKVFTFSKFNFILKQWYNL